MLRVYGTEWNLQVSYCNFFIIWGLKTVRCQKPLEFQCLSLELVKPHLVRPSFFGQARASKTLMFSA